MKLVRFLMNIPNSTNQPITVELKNRNIISGFLLSCNPLMNLHLKNVRLQQPLQDRFCYSTSTSEKPSETDIVA